MLITRQAPPDFTSTWGDKDEAFRWLERAFEERSHWLVWLQLDQRWKNLRGDPRFAEMVARMRYPTAG